jgi:hypothetical protein
MDILDSSKSYLSSFNILEVRQKRTPPVGEHIYSPAYADGV